MPNISIARGLIPVRYRSGAPYNGGYNTYFVPASDATAIFIGDPVKPVTASADANGIPTVTIATAAGGAFVLGAVVGIVSAGDPVIAQTRDKTVFRPASTAAYVLVADDPELLFEIQENGTMGVLAGSRNADLVAGVGSTNSGYSGWQLASSTLNTTNTLQLRILRPVERADNDPVSTSAKWLVSINLHAARNLTGV